MKGLSSTLETAQGRCRKCQRYLKQTEYHYYRYMCSDCEQREFEFNLVENENGSIK